MTDAGVRRAREAHAARLRRRVSVRRTDRAVHRGTRACVLDSVSWLDIDFNGWTYVNNDIFLTYARAV
jgi:hypothetical protein